MRYRPFARSGKAISAISLALDEEDGVRPPGAWRDFVHAAFEAGINTFDLRSPSSHLLQGFAEAASAVERRLIFVGLTLAAEAHADTVLDKVGWAIGQAGVGGFDLVSLEAGDSLSRGVVHALGDLRASGRTRRLAIAGEGEAMSDHVRTGDFDAIVTPFNILSGWRERRVIREAVDQQMAVIACDPYPAQVRDLSKTAVQEAKPGWFSKPKPLAGIGTYAFLDKTRGWTGEQICVGYALTEPSVASVQVRAGDAGHLAALAEVTERDLPASIGAQIEMARFSAERQAGIERRSA